MRKKQTEGPYWDVFEAPAILGFSLSVRVGIRQKTFQLLQKFYQSGSIAQYYGIVQDGMQNAQHLFRGLQRPLEYLGDDEADKSVYVYTWRPMFDFVWEGTPQEGEPIECSPPSNCVFAVLMREEPSNSHNVVGSIEHWSWIVEDQTLSGAPVFWKGRYLERLWSR